MKSARLLGKAACEVSNRKRGFKPCTLGFIALALAVVVWGYGYKLSLYFTTTDTDEIPAAKLWIEHRNGYSVEFQTHLERQLLRDQHWHSASMLAAGLLPDLVSLWSPFVPAAPPAARRTSLHCGAQLRAPPCFPLALI